MQALLPGRARETFLKLALCFARERESLALPCGSRTRGVPRVLDSVNNVGAAGFPLIPPSL